ncbi:serine/threonine-protein kinase [Spirillospora sp. NPDC029432]|uniref:serine/threonine-protein kinase n=1 Tax=Spirillospora sp. NPDC029432 TaxID=3154599 RepID=UPI00345371BF
MSDVASLLPEDPRRIGPYELRGRIGQGGQGVVYLGAAASGDPVAVKLLQASLRGDDPARARFVRELSVARRVARFCTAQVLDADIDGDRPYIVSEYVEGPSLAEVVAEKGPLPGAQLERLAIGTATALAAIHQAGIVHRDFKPANVLLGQDGPRVIDFGVAKALDPGSTGSSAVVGTPSYMAPEQVGAESVGPRADVWAWAATVVYAATGRPPFGNDTIPAVMGRILNAEPALGDTPEPLRELVRLALSKDPEARPASADLLMRLIGHSGEPTEIMAEGRTLAATRPDGTRLLAPSAPPAPPADPPTAVQPATGDPVSGPPSAGNRWVPTAISVVAVLIAIGAVFWAVSKESGAERERPGAAGSSQAASAGTGSAAPSSRSASRPAGPRLLVSPVGELKVEEKGSAVTVTLTAEGGTVEWRTEDVTDVTVSRAFGTLKSGQTAQVKIALTGPYSGYVDFEAEGTPSQRVALSAV